MKLFHTLEHGLQPGRMNEWKLIFIMLLSLTVTACKKEKTDNPIAPDAMTGTYQAVVCTEPGQHDRGVDILANGGQLTARLSSDLKVEGYVKIPSGIGSNFPPLDKNYSGTFSVSGDTVKINNTGIILDEYSPFVFKNSRLESVDRVGRGNPFKLILEK